MGILEHPGIISEMQCDSNLSIIIEDNTAFQQTEYKVLRHQQNSVFLECCKILFNGKTQLYYLTNGYVTLESIIWKVHEDMILQILTNLYESLIVVRNSGFLNIRGVIIEPKYIFFDRSTKQIKFAYLPLNRRIYLDDLTFENALRQKIVCILKQVNSKNNLGINWVISRLSDESLGLEQLYAMLKNSRAVKSQNTEAYSELKDSERLHCTKDNRNREYSDAVELKIQSLDARSPLTLVVSKNEYLIGRKATAVDGLISFNKLVGRIHCKINRQGMNFTITDLQSVNGTFLNERKLKPNLPYPISNGDLVRLANSEFVVRVE